MMMIQESKVIGLTGPIGAGKDEVVRVLRRRGAFVIDADKVAHTLYSSQNPVWRELVKVFGSRILNRGGMINRKKLAEMVFADKKLLQKLNRIIHPYLKETIMLIAEEQKAVGTALIVINAAVLKEIGLLEYVDEVWAVLASKELRAERLQQAGLSKKEIDQRLNSQLAQKEYLKLADVVIRNNGTLRQLAKQVQEKSAEILL
jgi:dephospho-CoA kinase